MIVSTGKRLLDLNRGNLSDYDNAVIDCNYKKAPSNKPVEMITTRLAVTGAYDIWKVKELVHRAITNTPEYNDDVKEKETRFQTYEEIGQHVAEGLCVVATVDNEIVGACYGEDEGGVIWLSWIAVMPEYQRRGIGEMLVEKFTDIVRGEGIRAPLGHKIACSSLLWNLASTKLFNKMGFIKDAVLIEHWHRLDFNLWSRQL